MTFKETMINFFIDYEGVEEITYADLKEAFDSATNYKYSSITAFKYFQITLLESKFLKIKQHRKIYVFNWVKIHEKFPELKKSKEK